MPYFAESLIQNLHITFFLTLKYLKLGVQLNYYKVNEVHNGFIMILEEILT